MWCIKTEAPLGGGIRHLVYGLNPLITVLREHDIKIDGLLLRSGIRRQLLTNPESQLTPDQELTFTTLALESLGGGPIGLELGQRYHCSSYGILGLAILTSVNLKQAVETIFENVMMTWTYFALSASAGRGEAKFAFSRERDLGRCFRYMSDRGISAAYTMFSEALGERIPLRYVHFMHEPPVQLQPYKDLFRCPIHFGGERSELCFDEEWMYRRLPQAEGSTHRIFSAQCRKVSRALTAHVRFSEIVRYNLLNDLAHYSYLKNIAERLSLSPRTVQRKLAQDKTSFTELVENVRRNLALEYLAESRLPICDIAERLGYGDTASFSHAFTRWVGHSPSKYRCQVYYWSHPD